MNKSELIEAIWSKFSQKTNKETISILVQACFDEIQNQVAQKANVKIRDFGTFQHYNRPEIKRKLPHSNKEQTFAARSTIKFIPSASTIKKLNP